MLISGSLEQEKSPSNNNSNKKPLWEKTPKELTPEEKEKVQNIYEVLEDDDKLQGKIEETVADDRNPVTIEERRRKYLYEKTKE